MKRTWLIAAMLCLAPIPAQACSLAAGFRPTSNLELVEQAETIVLARVTGGAVDERRPEESTITIRPLAALKGELPEGDIALRGLYLAEGRLARYGGLSDPFEFAAPHPDDSACIRVVFPLGTTAVFFLRVDHEGMWAPAAPPLSRWAEDVPDADAPWVQLVRLYAIAAGLPAADRAPFLADEREALLARSGEPLAQLMAADIARQLAPPAERTLEAAFRDPAEESAVEAALKAMRQAAIEAGN